MSVVAVGPGDDVAALARGAGGDVVLVVGPGMDALELARALASVGPLAVELAPAARINVVVAGEGAEPDDVAAAARFLDGARSTTGQVLEVGPR